MLGQFIEPQVEWLLPDHALVGRVHQERRAIEDAVSDLKEALKGDDAEAIKAKTNTVAQASMKLGEAMYKAQQGAEDGDSEQQPSDSSDDVVDAEFEEVDGDEKKSA